MKRGDIIYCKRAINKDIIGRVVVFNVGDKCTFEGFINFKEVEIPLITKEGSIRVPFFMDLWNDHFETIEEHRKRIIENLL